MKPSEFRPSDIYIKASDYPADVFNEPWMENLNQRLLFRWWKKSDTNKPLITWEYGTKLFHVKNDMGIMTCIVVPKFKPEEKEKFKKLSKNKGLYQQIKEKNTTKLSNIKPITKEDMMKAMERIFKKSPIIQIPMPLWRMKQYRKVFGDDLFYTLLYRENTILLTSKEGDEYAQNFIKQYNDGENN